MRPVGRLLAGLVVLGACAPLPYAQSSLEAQHAASSWTTRIAAEWPSTEASLHSEALGRAAEPSFSRALGGAAVGGIVAPAVAGVIGNAIAPRERGGYGYPGLMAGVAVGLVVGPPIGAHIGNQRRGDPYLTMLGATAGTALLAFAVRQANPEPGAFVILVPMTQIGLSAVIEHVTGR